MLFINPQTAGVPYTEQNHLHGQRQEFRITPKRRRKMILSSVAYITPIRLAFCMSTGERGGGGERVFVKEKKKNSKSVINHFTVK